MYDHRKVVLIVLNIFISRTLCAIDPSIVTKKHLAQLVNSYPNFLTLPVNPHPHYTKQRITCPLPPQVVKRIVHSRIDINANPQDPPAASGSAAGSTVPEDRVDIDNFTDEYIKGRRTVSAIVDDCMMAGESAARCYATYVNVMESAGLSFVYRFCRIGSHIAHKTQRVASLNEVKDAVKSTLSLIGGVLTGLAVSAEPVRCVETAWARAEALDGQENDTKNTPVKVLQKLLGLCAQSVEERIHFGKVYGIDTVEKLCSTYGVRWLRQEIKNNVDEATLLFTKNE